MANLANGQCAHRWPHANRCLELATTTRPLDGLPTRRPDEPAVIVYEVGLCPTHAKIFDRCSQEGK